MATRTPLVRLSTDVPPSAGGAPAEVWLKLENLQPIGAFKLRGAANALDLAPADALKRGVYTASAGNMALGVAWVARRRDLRCRVIVPEAAPETKLAAISRLGGEVIKVPFDDWWRVIVEHGHSEMDGYFIHPVSNSAVIAGNGTIGLEILEDLPDVDAVFVPYGGGGLSCGIAAALQGAGSAARTWACEVVTAAPLSAALAAGRLVTVDYVPSFVDGIGGKCVLDEMWPLAKSLLAGALVASLEDVATAVRLLALRNRIVAEGAGATPVAAALDPDIIGRTGARKIVCVVSGGNIDGAKLAAILAGDIP